MNSSPNANPHQNNFDLLRHFFAILVVYSHCFPPFTAGEQYVEPLELATKGQTTLGAIAVNSFFIISGYLIAQSYFRSKSAGEFVVKRVLRIYPGYYIALLFSAIVAVMGAYPSHLFYIRHTIESYSAHVADSLLVPSSAFLNRDYLFPNNPVPKAINGSMWTLRPELCCYLLILVLGLTGLLQRLRMIVFMTLLCLVFFYANGAILKRTNDATWRLGSSFLIGTLFALLNHRILRFSILKLAASLIILTIAARSTNAFNIAFATFGGYCILSIGKLRTLPGTGFVTRADLSYGIYLYSFPIQQLIISRYLLIDPYTLFVSTMIPVLIFAKMSWHFVESPAMKWRNTLSPYIK